MFGGRKCKNDATEVVRFAAGAAFRIAPKRGRSGDPECLSKPAPTSHFSR